jgi:hypothetical protein
VSGRITIGGGQSDPNTSPEPGWVQYGDGPRIPLELARTLSLGNAPPFVRTFAQAEQARIEGWWLCPNEPRCAHPAALHDVEDFDDPTPRCCAEGCDCGAMVITDGR